MNFVVVISDAGELKTLSLVDFSVEQRDALDKMFNEILDEQAAEVADYVDQEDGA